ncbi:PQQ-dependent sugar dehydrogenase [Lewinella sp. IMCC34191]|uniref:PQQ-dependent sugar dehydrogenase n=1 Tax=Lewinella sp. IMCC34191 TaxID=2259172 RepID=UPI0018E5305A|nr:PQQ-dependent sugar dehydrogenase [Lewinella sp. IMCC34191]
MPPYLNGGVDLFTGTLSSMRTNLYLFYRCFLSLALLSPQLTMAQADISYENAFPNLTFDLPVEIQHAGDGTDRLFVLEQPGRIKVFANDRGATASETFLDLTGIVSFSSGQEIGLLGLAFHPQFSSNRYFYVYHTRQSSVSGVNVELVLARYRVSATNPNRADPNSRLEIFSFDKNQRESNHNGGKIAFGPDGYLYASLGDGGGGGDPQGNAQNLNTIFGSILRIDVDLDGSNPVETNPDAPNGRYEIPSDNPRVGRSGLDELYAWGIRNTWKFSFDGATGRLWGGDVGQGVLEEINLLQRGGNYGWNRFEGTGTYRSATSLVTTPDTKPVYTYNHDNGDRSITLGYVYRGRLTNPAIRDKLLFADYVSGRVWAMDYDETAGTGSAQLLFRTNGEPVSSFGLDEAGEIYFSEYDRSGSIFRIVDENDTTPTTTAVDGLGSWQALGSGISGVVDAIATDGDRVYAAGNFTTAGGRTANNLAVYTPGDGWRALASGSNGRISALTVGADGRLYAGGSFTTIGGVSARNIAVWDGTAWQALGSGTNGAVLALASNGSDVYAGGTFVTAGGRTVNNIARWNGSWTALTDSGTGVAGTNNEVRSIAFDETGTLYIGGNFGSAGNRTANRIATFNGSRWGTLGSGTSGFVQAIVITDDNIYAGGNFAIAGGRTVNRVARWDRSARSWQALGQGVSGNVNSLYHDGTYLYVGGSFETATTGDNQSYIVNNVTRWSDALQWQALGTGKSVGTNNLVNTLVPVEDGLYAGGNFTTAGATTAGRVARWTRPDCSLIPYVNINRSGWTQANTVLIEAGDEVWFGPQSVDFGITSSPWSYTGPNNFTSTGRSLRLTDVGLDRAGDYTVTNTDPDGCTASLTYTIEIDDPTVPIVNGTVYEMEPQHDTRLRLDVREGSTENSTLVDGYRRHGSANQQWKFISLGNNVYEIEPQNAIGKRLDVAGGSRATNTEIHIYERHSSNNQRWQALPVGDGTYRFAPLNAPDNRLDIENVGGVPRALSRTLDRGNSQRWRLIPVGTAAVSRRSPAAITSPLSLKDEFVLYPNPVSSQLTVESRRDYRLELYDVSGRRVLDARYAEGVTQVEMGRFPAGTYVVKLIPVDGQEATTVQIVKE